MHVNDTGIVFRNPIPHVWSRHAYFPSLVNLGDGELICAFVMAQAFEAEDARLHLCRSHDGGQTWEHEGRMFSEREAPAYYFESGRMAQLADGSLLMMVCVADKHRRDEGLSNPATLGFVEATIVSHRSTDGGRTWTAAVPVTPPLEGPVFEICCPPVPLHDGRVIYPCSTWKAWDGANPSGMKAVAFISGDNGATWPQYAVTLDGSAQGVVHWESKVVELAPGTLLAVSWAFDEPNSASLANHFALSTDGGASFSPAAPTDLSGETPALLPLGPEEALCVYRRTDVRGLYAARVSLAGGQWTTGEQVEGYGTGTLYATDSQNQSEKFAVLRFGAPCVIRLDDRTALAAFWAVEECVSNIRWVRLTL